MIKKIIVIIAAVMLGAASSYAMDPVKVFGSGIGLEDGNYEVSVRINDESMGSVKNVEVKNGTFSFRLDSEIAGYTFNANHILTLSTSEIGVFYSRRMDLVLLGQALFGSIIQPEDINLDTDFEFTGKMEFKSKGGNDIIEGDDEYPGSALISINPTPESGVPTIEAGKFIASSGYELAGYEGSSFEVNTMGEVTTAGMTVNGETSITGGAIVGGCTGTNGLALTGIMTADDADGDDLIAVELTPEIGIVKLTSGDNTNPDAVTITQNPVIPVGQIIFLVNSGGSDVLNYNGTNIDGSLMLIKTDPGRWDVVGM